MLGAITKLHLPCAGRSPRPLSSRTLSRAVRSKPQPLAGSPQATGPGMARAPPEAQKRDVYGTPLGDRPGGTWAQRLLAPDATCHPRGHRNGTQMELELRRTTWHPATQPQPKCNPAPRRQPPQNQELLAVPVCVQEALEGVLGPRLESQAGRKLSGTTPPRLDGRWPSKGCPDTPVGPLMAAE